MESRLTLAAHPPYRHRLDHNAEGGSSAGVLVSRTRSPLPKSGVGRRRWQGATTRNSWRYSEEEQRSQRRRDAPEFGDGLRVRDTRTSLRQPERPVLRLGVGVLELEDAEAREGLAHPRREQSEPAEVRDHTREQHAPEDLRGGGIEHHPLHLLAIPAHGARDLVPHQSVPHQLAGIDDEVLAVAQLGRRYVAVELGEREHAEGHVARLVLHHVAHELLQERFLRDLEHVPEGGHGQTLDDDLHAEVLEVPAAVGDGGVEELLQVLVDRPLPLELVAQILRKYGFAWGHAASLVRVTV